MRQRIVIFFLVFWGGTVFLLQPAAPQENKNAAPSVSPESLSLFQAVMCEEISANAPQYQTVIFSVAKEKAICFTSFDTVSEKTFIYHNWFYKDIPSSRIRLVLQPPRWSTYSSIQIRKTDIGPWRVEITDSKGNILHILRFSITD